MKLRYLAPLILILSLAWQPLLAETDMHKPIREMASILMQLNHNPSDQEKASLNEIAASDGYSANIRTIAQSMINLNHRASSRDKDRLRQIMSDRSATIAEQELAKILVSLNHQPSRGDKQALRQLIDNPRQSWASN